MEAHFCDLCGTIIKGDNYDSLFYFNREIEDTLNYSLMDFIAKLKKEKRDVCPTCKLLFDRIFELKRQRFNEIIEELENTLGLPSKNKPKDKKEK